MALTKTEIHETPLPRLVASGFFGYLRPSRCDLRVWLRKQGVAETPPGPFAETLMRLGLEHEVRHLQRFPNHVDLGPMDLQEATATTIDCVSAGNRVIYQGALRVETELAGRRVEIVGLPDFMLPARHGYAIRDSKLNRRIRPSNRHITLQLQTYGWLYEQTFEEQPVALQIHAGTGEIFDIEYDGGAEALATFEQMLVARESETEPVEYVAVSKCSGCGYRNRCWPPAEERHEIGLLPRVDRGLLKELHSRGTHTLEDLLRDWDIERLAALERPWGQGLSTVKEVKARRVLTAARALLENRPIVLAPAAIPEHSTYVMFDLEGMPPRHDEMETVYIWGMQRFGSEPGPFTAATAGFGPRGDLEGWESFLHAARVIFDQHGDLPFVHWASYELAKINLYLNRYGDRNGVAERIKRNLLDLLPITYDSVALPLSSYSLKDVETLTGYQRTLEESGGDWSMASYVEATETRDRAKRDAIMDEILAYNREDLEATWAVMDWLRGLTSTTAPRGRPT